HRESGHRFYPWSRPLLAALMRRIATRVAVSNAARQTIARHFPGHYSIVPNGIDAGRFRTPVPRPPDMLDDRLHVLYVGRIEPRKGVEHLVEAIAIAGQEVRNLELVVVGDGPDRDALNARTKAARIAVRFVGRVGDDQLNAYYQAADVVCSPATGGESL